jgi:RNA polymerase sigma-70 factor (family 1)
MDAKEIEKLIIRIKASDHHAFKIIFDLYQQEIFRFLLYQTKDSLIAEDLLQEVFFKLWKARENLDKNQSIKNYLYTIADNLALNHLRHLKVVARHEAQSKSKLFSDTQGPQFILEEKESAEHLKQAIENLPEKSRVVFMMSRFDDLSYHEIADRLSLSVKTVESHMSKALKLLREKISIKI